MNNSKKNHIALAVAAAFGLAGGLAQAQVSDNVVRIGVLTDMSGAYSDLAGGGSVLATQMAVDDFKAKNKVPFAIEVVSADHQNKGDISSNKAREWFDREKVDVVTDLVTTSTAPTSATTSPHRSSRRAPPSSVPTTRMCRPW